MSGVPQIDLEADSQEKAIPKDDALASIAMQVDRWDTAKRAKAKAEQESAAAQLIINEVERVALPAAMAEAGVKEFKTVTGRVVTMDTTANGNIPAPSTIEKARGSERTVLEARRRGALEYVRQTWPGLLKTEVSVALGVGEAELALRIAELLRERFELTPEVAENVNPNTLNAHFKELNRAGKLGGIPTELFNLYIGPIAKIK